MYLRDKKRWTTGKVLEDLTLFERYKASNVSRRLRELAEDGIIDRIIEKRGRLSFVAYRYKKIKESTVWKNKGKHRVSKV